MAYTKIFAVRKRLNKTIHYVMNPEKTDAGRLVSALNCIVQTVYPDMMATKKRWNQLDGVQGYHIIQSFEPNTGTAEQIHEIGVAFATELFGENYEAVVATHIDHDHLHNHIVINSVSFMDGKKYHSSPDSYYHTMRDISDALCEQKQLPTITPKHQAIPYIQWQAEKQGKPTMRSMVRADIDDAIQKAYSFQTFIQLLEKRGYVVNQDPRRKYMTVRYPGAKRSIRLASLGDDYTEKAIKERFQQQRTKSNQAPIRKTRVYRIRSGNIHRPKRKITGFLALYFRYIYLLRGVRKKTKKHYLSYSLRKEVTRLERYQKQFQYLLRENIETDRTLAQKISELEKDIASLETARRPLYEKRKAAIGEEQEQYQVAIEQYGMVLREKRKELRLCRAIGAQLPQMTENMMEIAISKHRKEVKKDEHQWRNR